MQKNSNSKYTVLLAHLFFLLFTCPVLSPEIPGTDITIYFYFFIPLIDYKFISFLSRLRYRLLFLIVFFALIGFIIASLRLFDLVKLFTAVEVLLYLYYLRKIGLFSIFYGYMFFNILFAVLQCIFYYVNPEYMYLIGPDNISSMLWGEDAAATFTNFYTIFLFPRFSGLSREAGFFASLVGLAFICYLYDESIEKKKKYLILFWIGIILSFSKASFLILLIFLILWLRKLLNTIPMYLGITLYIIIASFFVNTLYQNTSLLESQTFTHRLSGYLVMDDLTPKEYLFGVEEITDLQVFRANKYPILHHIESFNNFTGLPELLIHHGVFVFLSLLFLFYVCGFKFSDFLILILVTFTTSFFTSQSFIILGYFFVMVFLHKASIPEPNIQEQTVDMQIQTRIT